jgi:hypothetical protein
MVRAKKIASIRASGCVDDLLPLFFLFPQKSNHKEHREHKADEVICPTGFSGLLSM